MAVITDFLLSVLWWWLFLFIIDRIMRKVTGISWQRGLILTLVQIQ